MMSTSRLSSIVLLLCALASSDADAQFDTRFCTPNYPLCLTTPQEKALNLAATLPSGISNSRINTGGIIPGLRSHLAPILDQMFPLLPNYFYYGGADYLLWWWYLGLFG